MNPIARHPLGNLSLTRLGFGGAPLGNLMEAVSDADAWAAMSAAWDAGVRYFDTAPWYGLGLSEHRVGAFLRTRPREEYVLSTKVGRRLRPWPPRNGRREQRGPWVEPLDFEVRFDYSYDGVIRAWEDSLQRLGLPEVDILLVHDLDRLYHPPGAYEARLGQLSNGGIEALRDLRADGRISAIGVGVNAPGTISDMLDRFEVDLFLVAGPYTLLEQEILETELARAAASGARVVIGASFRSGLLATGTRGLSPERLAEIEPAAVARTDRLEATCARHGVPLAAAALQFPAAHPAVASVLVGAMDESQERQALEWMSAPIPAELWRDLKSEGLLPSGAPVPGDAGDPAPPGGAAG